jgi:uncharacterized membrane protein YbhN (UPF0104 family)
VARTPEDGKRTSRWGYAARVLFVLVVVAVLVRVGVHNAHSLRHVDLHLHPLWLAAAVPFTLLGGLFLPLGWRALLAAYGADLGVAPSLRIWCVSQASRYIPTGVAAFASRIVLTAREGVARSVAGATMLVELGVVIAWSGLAGGVLVPSSVVPTTWRVLLAGGAAVPLLALPTLLRVGGRLVPRLPRLGPHSLRTRPLRESELLFAANALVKSIGFVLFADALLGHTAHTVALLAGSYNLAQIAGMVGVTPSGLGVREGVMAALLHTRFGLGNAAALAVALRGYEFVIELVWLAAASALARRVRASAPARSGSNRGG